MKIKLSENVKLRNPTLPTCSRFDKIYCKKAKRCLYQVKATGDIFPRLRPKEHLVGAIGLMERFTPHNPSITRLD